MSLRDEGSHWCRRHVEGGAQRVGAAANVADVPQVDQLLHGAETYVWVTLDTPVRPSGRSMLNRTLSGRLHPGQAVTSSTPKAVYCAGSSARSNAPKVQLRAKVEHPFQVIKVGFNHRKVRYRGLEKIRRSYQSGLANLTLAKRYLQQATGQIRLKGGTDPQISKMRRKTALEMQNNAGRLKKPA